MSNAPASAENHAKLLIVGSGPAGYTTAIYAARAMLAPVMIAGFEPGGQLMITTDVENYPGFAEPIQGPWLMEQMKAQAEHVGARMVSDHVVRVELGRRPFTVHCDSGAVWTCDTLVVATGAKAKLARHAVGGKFKGYGVSACATCDGFFYRGKEVDGRRRRQFGRRGGALSQPSGEEGDRRASPRRLPLREDFAGAAVPARQCRGDLGHAIDEILGQQNPPGVTHVRLKNVKTGARSRTERRRRVRRHRPRAGLGAVRRPTRPEAERDISARRRIRPPPTSPASSPPATSPTTSTARR
jgi:thioredoxin reductase (NADPH)